MPEPVPGRTESPVPFLAQARQARARQSDQQAVARNQEAESERNVLQNRDIRSARSRENIVADRDRIRNAGAAQAGTPLLRKSMASNTATVLSQ